MTEPLRAVIEVEWTPSASIGETDAVNGLLEGQCEVIMDRLVSWAVVDPSVGLTKAKPEDNE